MNWPEGVREAYDACFKRGPCWAPKRARPARLPEISSGGTGVQIAARAGAARWARLRGAPAGYDQPSEATRLVRRDILREAVFL